MIVTLQNAGNASTWGMFLTCRASPTYSDWHVTNVPHIDEVTIKAVVVTGLLSQRANFRQISLGVER